jgi:hypothetical protein
MPLASRNKVLSVHEYETTTIRQVKRQSVQTLKSSKLATKNVSSQ